MPLWVQYLTVVFSAISTAVVITGVIFHVQSSARDRGKLEQLVANLVGELERVRESVGAFFRIVCAELLFACLISHSELSRIFLSSIFDLSLLAQTLFRKLSKSYFSRMDLSFYYARRA